MNIFSFSTVYSFLQAFTKIGDFNFDGEKIRRHIAYMKFSIRDQKFCPRRIFAKFIGWDEGKRTLQNPAARNQEKLHVLPPQF